MIDLSPLLTERRRELRPPLRTRTWLLDLCMAWACFGAHGLPMAEAWRRMAAEWCGPAHLDRWARVLEREESGA